MGSIADLLPLILQALSSEDLDLGALLGGLLSGSGEAQQGQ